MKTSSRYGMGTKALSMFLSILMTFSVVAVGITPLSETVAHAAGPYATSYPRTANRLREYYYAPGTKFVYELAMYYSSESNDKAKQGLINGGYTPVGGNFNASDGKNSKYVHLGVRYKDTPDNTVRAFRISYTDEIGNKNIESSGIILYYKVGSGAASFVPAVLDGVVDLNRGTGNTANLKLFATADVNAFFPVTDIGIAYTEKASDVVKEIEGNGYKAPNGAIVKFFENVNENANCNRSCPGDTLYMGYKSSVQQVSTDALRAKMAEIAPQLNDMISNGFEVDEFKAAMDHAIAIINDYDEEPEAGKEGYSNAYDQEAIDKAISDLDFRRDEAVANNITSDFMFVVPEAIYLTPGAQTFQYYVNNNADGSVIQAAATQGKIYYNYSGAANATVSGKFYNANPAELSGGSITLSSSSISSGTTGVTITGGSAPSNASCYIIWTLTYNDTTDNNRVKSAVAMTYVYKPFVNAVAAIANTNVGSSDATCGAVWTALWGIHEIVSSWSSSLNLDSDYSHNSDGDNFCTYKYTLENHETSVNYQGWAAPSTSDIVSAVGSAVSATDPKTGASYFYKSEDKNSATNVDVAGGVGKIYYDSSRYDRLGKIPNLYVHSFYGGFKNKGTAKYLQNVSSWLKYYIVKNGSVSASSKYSTTKYDQQDTNVHKGADPDLSNVEISGDFTFYNVIYRYWQKKDWIGTTRNGRTDAVVGVNFKAIDKFDLRKSVQTAITLMAQFGVTGYSDGHLQSIYFGGDQTWIDFSNAFINASKALTKLDGSCDPADLKNKLDNAIKAIKTQVYFDANYDNIGVNLFAPTSIGSISGMSYDSSSEQFTLNGSNSGTIAVSPFIPESGATYKITLEPTGGMTNGGKIYLEAVKRNDNDVISISPQEIFEFSGNETKTWTVTAAEAKECRALRLTCQGSFTGYKFRIKVEKVNSTAYSPAGRQAVIGSYSAVNFSDFPDHTELLRDGYECVGWSTSPYAETGSSPIKVKINTVLYAAWHRNESTLTVNPNGGSWNGSSENSTVKKQYLDKYDVQNPFRTGYNFVNWNVTANAAGGQLNQTQEDGRTTSSVYTFGPNKDKNDTITANWAPITYTISFDNGAEKYPGGNFGGSMTAMTGVKYDETKDLTANGFTRTNTVTYDPNGGTLPAGTSASETVSSTFAGWERTKTVVNKDDTETTTTENYTNGQSVINLTETDNDTVTLKAKWTYGKASCPTPERTGYTFDGWYTAANGGTKVTSAISISTNMTLYAHWIINTNGLYINSNGGASQNNLVYLKDGASTFSGGSTSTITFKSEYEADGDLKITGKRYNTGSGETTANPIGYVYLENGKTYRVSFKSTNNVTDFYMFAPTGHHCNTMDGEKYRVSIGGGLYETVKTFTVGVQKGDCSWHNATDKNALTGVYYMRIDQDAYVGDGSYTVTDFRIVEVTESEGVDNHITQEYNTKRDIPNPVRTGYNFVNWVLDPNTAGGSINQTTSNGRTTSSVFTFGPNKNVFDIITANWEPIHYTVEYDANRGADGHAVGSVDVANSAHTYDAAKNLNRNTYTRTNTVTYVLNGGAFDSGTSNPETVYSTFDGWNTKADGSGTKYTDEKSVKNLTTVDGATVKLYAQWKMSGASCPVPSRKGYLSSGWYSTDNFESGTEVTASTPISKDITLYEKWTPITYYIVFNSNKGSGSSAPNGSTATVTATYDKNAALTANGFTRAGYTFTGWNTKADGTGTAYADKATVINLSYTLNEQVTLYAQWKANTYNVKYDANRGTGADGSGTMANSTHIYDTAKALTANAYTRYSTVTFDYKGADGNCSTETANAVATFKGWNTKANGSGDTVIGTGKNDTDGQKDLATENNATVSVYAQWNYGTITLPSPTRTGYLFEGWYLNSDYSGSPVTETTTYSTNVTLYAKWKPIRYSVFYKGVRTDIGDESSVSGTTAVNTSVAYDDEFYLSDNGFTRTITLTYDAQGGDEITATTYSTEFDHWYGLTFDPLTKNYTYSAYAAQQKVSKLNKDDNGEVELYAEWKSKEVTLPTPVKPGFTFNYWCSDSSCENAVTLVDEKFSFNKNTTVYAKWTENKYNIAYTCDGAKDSSSTASQTDILYTKGTKLNANGFKRYYVITYDSKGTTTDPVSLTTAAANTQAVQTFTGWKGSVYNPSTRTYSEQTFSASDVASKTYSKLAEGTSDHKTVTLKAQWSNGKISVLPVPTRTGYTFDGWYTSDTYASGTKVSTSTEFAKDTTLYAKWVENKYNLTLKSEGAADITSEKTYTESVTLSNPFTKSYAVTYHFNDGDGKTKATWSDKSTGTKTDTAAAAFTGWSGETFNPADKSFTSRDYAKDAVVSRLADGNDHKAVTLTAKWELGTVTPPTPVRTGYDFDGWYTAASGGTKVTDETKIDKNTDVYAHWTVHTYNIAFNSNDVPAGSTDPEGEMATINGVKYDANQVLTDNSFTREGYKFNGWNTEADGKGTAYADKAAVDNLTAVDKATVTLYAQWAPISYTISYNGNGNTNTGVTMADTTGVKFDGTYAVRANEYKNSYSLTLNLNDTAGSTRASLAGGTGSASFDYGFAGWAKSADGEVVIPKEYDGKTVNGDMTKNLTTVDGANVTLYAKWEYKPITLPVPVRVGYIFGGWFTDAACSSGKEVELNSDGTYTPQGTITLYAKWTPIKYNIAFEGNKGAGSTDIQGTVAGVNNVVFDQAITGFPTDEYTRKGYIFKGWNTKADGTGTAYTGSLKNLTAIIGATANIGGSDKVITEANVTDNYNGATVKLYAQWEPVKYNIYFSDGTATEYDPQIRTFDKPEKLSYSGIQVALSLKYYVNNGIETDPVSASDTKVEVINWKDSDGNTYDKNAEHTNILFDKAQEERKLEAVLGDRGSVESLPTYYKNGHSFAGWYENPGFTGDCHKAGNSFEFLGDVSLYAKWNPVVYDVEFDGNTATSGVPAKITDKTFGTGTVTVGADPAKVNTVTFDSNGGFTVEAKTITYTFNGWKDAKGVSYAAGTHDDIFDKDNIPANYEGTTKETVTVKAEWAKNPYTLPVPVRPGYTFSGWYDTETDKKVESVDLLEKNITVKAKWTANSYTVTLSGNGNTNTPGASSTTYSGTFGEKLTVNNPFERKFSIILDKNYPSIYAKETETKTFTSDFLGWAENSANTIKYYESATETTDYGASAFNAAYYANKNGLDYNKYAIVEKYAKYGGSASGTDAKDYFDAGSNGAVDLFNMSTVNGANVGLTAKWADKKYTLPTLTKTGYIFGGWYTNAECTEGYAAAGTEVTVSADKTYYAKWTPITYTVAFDSNRYPAGSTAPQGSIASVSGVKYDEAKALTANNNSITRTGYTFNGWNTASDGTGTSYADGADVKNLTSTDGATVTLYAKWKPVTYKVSYNGNADSVSTVSGKMDEKTTATFDSSFVLNGNGFSRTITVTFNYNGADGGNSEAGKTVSTDFEGWALANNGAVKFTNGQTVTENLANVQDAEISLFAKWKKAAIVLPVPTRTGYKLDGWYTTSNFADGTKVSSETLYGENTTIYAKWIPITYKIAYDGNGNTAGTMDMKTTATYDAEYTLEKNLFTKSFAISYDLNDGGENVTKADELVLSEENTVVAASFDGWSLTKDGEVKFGKDKDGKSVKENLSSVQDAEVTLFAKWGEVSFVLPEATRTGYKFDGWFTAPDGGNKVNGVSDIPSGSAKLYAHWTPITYSIKFEGNGATEGSMSDLTPVTYDKTATLTLNKFSRTGYTFDGWYTASDGTGTYYADGAEIKNLTSTDGAIINLYAKWKPITYNVAFDGNGATGGSIEGFVATYDVEFNLPEGGFEKKFTVTYEYNGATKDAAPESQEANAEITLWTTDSGEYAGGQSVKNLTAIQGATVTLAAKWSSASVTLPSPYKTGYTFKGWFSSSTFEEKDKVGDKGGAYAPTADVKLYAKWEANPYVVNYNGNGATGVENYSQNRKFDDGASLNPNEFEKEFTVLFEYEDEGENPVNPESAPESRNAAKSVFKGWAKTADGEKVYDDGYNGNMIVDNEPSVDLYAVWDDSNSYLILPQPIRPGFDFLGWYTTDKWSEVDNDEYIQLKKYVYNDIKKKIDDPSYSVTWTMPEGYTLGEYTDSWEIPDDWYELPDSFVSPKSTYYAGIRYDFDDNDDGKTDRYEEWYYPESKETTLYARWSDVNPPEVEVVSVTRNPNNDNSYTIKFNFSDNEGITRYFWGKSASFYGNAETVVPETVLNSGIYPKNVNDVEFTVEEEGIYYITVIDKAGNNSARVNTYAFYTTTFNALGGSVSGPGKMLTYEKEENLLPLPTPTRAGYTFGGWSSKEYNGIALNSASYKPTATADIYAKWTPKLAEFDTSYKKDGINVDVATNLFVPREIKSDSSSGIDVSYDETTGIITLNGDGYADTSVLIKSPFKPKSGSEYRMTYEVIGGTASGADLVLKQATPLGTTDVESRNPQIMEFRWSAANEGIVSQNFTYNNLTADTVAWLQFAVEKNGTPTFNNYQIRIKVEDVTESEPAYEYSPAAMLLDNSEAVDVPVALRTGYHQTGWYTKPDSTGTLVEKIQPGSDPMTLYVRWEANKYRVVYNFNSTAHQGGTTVLDKEYTYDVRDDLAENGFTSSWRVTFTPQFKTTIGAPPITAEPPKYIDAYATFIGWSLTPDGSEMVTDAMNLTAENETVTLYAIWEDAVIELPNAAQKGLTLLGWYDQKDDNKGNRIGGVGSEYVPTADITLYGHWISLGITNKVIVYDFASGTIGSVFDKATDALEKKLYSTTLTLGQSIINEEYLGSSTVGTNIVPGFDGCDYSILYNHERLQEIDKPEGVYSYSLTSKTNIPAISSDNLEEYSTFKIKLENGCLNEPITLYFELKFNFQKDEAFQYINGKITLVPANSVYFEEDMFKAYDTINEEDAEEEWFNAGAEWSTLKSDKTLDPKTVPANSVYGFSNKYDDRIDGYYDWGIYKCSGETAGYSAGTVSRAAVDENMRVSRMKEFKFEGKGFELVSDCGVNTSGLMVYVWKQVGSNYKLISNTIVDTRLNDGENLTKGGLLCQVPVYHYMAAERGTYLVQVQAVYLDDIQLQGAALDNGSNLQMLANELKKSGVEVDKKLLDVQFVDEESVLNGGEAPESGSIFGNGVLNAISVSEILVGASAPNYGYIDGIRVYNPTTEEKYYAAQEKDARFFNVKQNAEISYKYKEYTVSNSEGHDNNGLNEIYLGPQNTAEGKDLYCATAFSIIGFRNDGTQRVMVSLRAAKGNPTVYVTNIQKTGDLPVPVLIKEIHLKNSTEMYYDVTDCVGSDGSLVIANVSDRNRFAAVCNIKVTNVSDSLVGISYLESKAVEETIQMISNAEEGMLNVVEYQPPVYGRYVEPEETEEIDVPDTPDTPDVPDTPDTPDTPEEKKPVIYIAGAKSTYTVDYRSKVNFYANVKNVPDGGKVVWYDGTKKVGEGTTYTIEEAATRAKITAKVLRADGTIAVETDSVTVNVRGGFIQKLIAFFKKLLKILPVVNIGR
ncbi:MAG: InlB B-repeat-containing protein [Clostridia bacterium]|nr:InlB B-repeat-containing protein [Clostridia bacterium]